ncbi:ornithine cyclodeaminase family protein [Georgenia sp. H159]|uniref:ornithine cyclodeaminase family protein n=1 Tax=Georgenia sp. H159 TaxID=3076115 RepID=UPI002D78A4AE|nr:ornithine cyclodeaminase family protein [Georgenia sp. H159]
MTLLLSDTDVRQVLSWTEAVETLREAYRAESRTENFPERTMARGDQVWLRNLSGVMPDGSLMGGKYISLSIRGGAASYLISLFDQETSRPLAIMDGNSITGFRTAATTALALDYLSPQRDHLTVGVIGSGFEAQSHLRAFAAVRDVASAKVFSPNPASRQRFIEGMGDLAMDLEDCESPQEAARDVDVVLCAARARGEAPTFHGDWIQPGMTIASIGSTLPEQRELDVTAIDRVDRIVVDMLDEVIDDTGDMIEARRAAIDVRAKTSELTALVANEALARQDDTEVLLFKSVGSAIQDLAVAALARTLAQARGIGTTTDVFQSVRK